MQKFFFFDNKQRSLINWRIASNWRYFKVGKCWATRDIWKVMEENSCHDTTLHRQWIGRTKVKWKKIEEFGKVRVYSWT